VDEACKGEGKDALPHGQVVKHPPDGIRHDHSPEGQNPSKRRCELRGSSGVKIESNPFGDGDIRVKGSKCVRVCAFVCLCVCAFVCLWVCTCVKHVALPRDLESKRGELCRAV
jgi:hypothetical protein